MDTLSVINPLRERLRFLMEDDIDDFNKIEKFDYKKIILNITICAKNPERKKEINTFIEEEIAEKVRSVKAQIPNIVDRTTNLVYPKAKYFHPNGQYSDGDQTDDSTILFLKGEMSYYQKELIEKLEVEPEVSGDNVKIIFNLSVEQLASLIRILIENEIIDGKQYKKGDKMAFARVLCRCFNTNYNKNKGKPITVNSMYNKLSMPQQQDLEFFQKRLNSINISVANLIKEIQNRPDKAIKKGRIIRD